MHIVLLSDDYLPESTRNHANMFHQLAIELLSRGHEVSVVTPGRPDQEDRLVVEFLDKVQIFRFKSSPIRGVGKVQRAINESLLSFRAYLAIRSVLSKIRFDICVNYSPTIFFGPLAWLLRRKGAYIYLVLRDFFPQWIIDEGMIKEGSVVARYFQFFESLNYRSSDCIAVQSPANLPLFRKMCPDHPNVRVLMNWASSHSVNHTLKSVGLRERLGLKNKVIFFYGGNIGHAQDMTNILKLARSMSHFSSAHFLLVGQGDEFDLVSRVSDSWNLKNLTLLPSVSQEEYRSILGEVDVGLFSLSKKHKAHNFPGKLLGYMAQSLPILGSVNEGNDVIETITSAGAGLVTVNGQDGDFQKNAERLLGDREVRLEMGKNSNQLLHTTFSVKTAADEIINQMIEAC